MLGVFTTIFKNYIRYKIIWKLKDNEKMELFYFEYLSLTKMHKFYEKHYQSHFNVCILLINIKETTTT